MEGEENKKGRPRMVSIVKSYPPYGNAVQIQAQPAPKVPQKVVRTHKNLEPIFQINLKIQRSDHWTTEGIIIYKSPSFLCTSFADSCADGYWGESNYSGKAYSNRQFPVRDVF